MDRVAGPLVLQVAFQHGGQPLLAAQLWFQGGEGPALPDGAGLAGGGAGFDHGQEPVGLLGQHPGVLQPLVGDRQQPLDQLVRRDRHHPAAGPQRPGQLGPQAQLGGPVEVVVGLLEGDPADPGVGVGGQGQGEAEGEGGVGAHVDDRGPGGQGPQLDANMAAVGGVVDGPVPAPHRALVQAQLLQGGHPAPLQLVQRPFGADHGQDRLVQPHALLQQLQGAGADPAGPERHPGDSAAGPAGGVAVVDRLLEQRHPGLLPSRWPRKVGEFPAAANTGAVASWAALKWAVNRSGSTRRWSWKEVLAPSRPTSSAAILQGVVAVDPDPERLPAQPPQAVVEGR